MLLDAIRQEVDQLDQDLSMRTLFGKTPLLQLGNERSYCDCGQKLLVKKTCQRTVATMEIGRFIACETVLWCSECRRSYGSEALKDRVAPYCNYGFDVMEFIGWALFVRSRTESQIQEELGLRNIEISKSEIGYLGYRFIIYLAIAHREGRAAISRLLQRQGGYVLHLDGTCDGASPHLMTVLDGISEVVLHNVKLPSENTEQISALLREVKKDYGNPVALVHDMGNAICSAASEVFPGTPDYICHFHFLRDIGNDLFATEHEIIAATLKKYKARTKLKNLRKRLQQRIEQDQKLTHITQTYLSSEKLDSIKDDLPPIVRCFVLVAWALESNCQLGGFGFPFDRRHLLFYQRLQSIYPLLQQLRQSDSISGLLADPADTLKNVLNDFQLTRTVKLIIEKVTIFDQLRNIMKIALPSNSQGLNAEDDIDMQDMEQALEKFCSSATVLALAKKHRAVEKMLTQIKKYWNKLFVVSVPVTVSGVTTFIYPQRTNNILEQFFRLFKKTQIKRTGNADLSKLLKTILADTPLVQNLANPEYLKAILNGAPSLAKRFAQIDAQLVRRQFASSKQQNFLSPKIFRKLAKIPDFPKLLTATLKKAA